MTRRTLLRSALFAGLMAALPACRRPPEGTAAERSMPFEPLAMSEGEWRNVLSPEQFAVLRDHGTERAFSSPLEHEKLAGTYVCAGCVLPLFTSAAKFDSGHG